MSYASVAAFRPSAVFDAADVRSIDSRHRPHLRASSGLPGLRTIAEKHAERRRRRGARQVRTSIATLEANERREAEREAWYEQRHQEWTDRRDRLRAWRLAAGVEHATPRQMKEMGL